VPGKGQGSSRTRRIPKRNLKNTFLYYVHNIPGERKRACLSEGECINNDNNNNIVVLAHVRPRYTPNRFSWSLRKIIREMSSAFVRHGDERNDTRAHIFTRQVVTPRTCGKSLLLAVVLCRD